MSLSTFVSFHSQFVTYLLTFPHIIHNLSLPLLFISKLFFYLHPTKIHCEILMSLI